MRKWQWLIAAALLLALLLIALAFHVQAQPQITVISKASPWDQRMIDLDLEALDEAYKDTITHLFGVFVRGDADQPGRTIIGAAKARRSYVLVREAIEKREQRLKEEPK